MGKLGQILKILNTVVTLGVLGFFIFTTFIFKRPKIIENKERERLVTAADQAAVSDGKRILIPLESITANLDPYTENGKTRSHYVQMAITVELIDEKQKENFDRLKPVILDRINSTLSKKKFDELNQVQGRYIFRSQIIDSMNEILASSLVVDIYFTDFLLQ
jgi:flagellar basal body-associated protein FliL